MGFGDRNKKCPGKRIIQGDTDAKTVTYFPGGAESGNRYAPVTGHRKGSGGDE